MGLGQAQDERVFDVAGGVERGPEASEQFIVFLGVFFGEDDEGGGGQAVFQAVGAGAFFAFGGFGPAFGAVAAVGLALSF